MTGRGRTFDIDPVRFVRLRFGYPAGRFTAAYIVEHGPTEAMFSSRQDRRVSYYVHGRFG